MDKWEIFKQAIENKKKIQFGYLIEDVWNSFILCPTFYSKFDDIDTLFGRVELPIYHKDRTKFNVRKMISIVLLDEHFTENNDEYPNDRNN